MVKIHFVVFWVVTPYSVAVGYQRFGEPCCLYFKVEVGGRTVLWKGCIQPLHYTAHKPRKPWIIFRKSQI